MPVLKKREMHPLCNIHCLRMTIQVNQDVPGNTVLPSDTPLNKSFVVDHPGSSSHAADASGNLRSNVTTSVPVSYFIPKST
jgi:hypothetical protein